MEFNSNATRNAMNEKPASYGLVPKKQHGACMHHVTWPARMKYAFSIRNGVYKTVSGVSQEAVYL
jgi:hypothetical protein